MCSSFRSSLGPRLSFVWNHSPVVSSFHVWNSYGHNSTWKPIYFYGMQERRLNGKIIDNLKFMYFCNATSRKVMCSKKQETKLKSMFPLGSRAFAFLLFELKARKYNASILMPTSKRSLVFSKNGGNRILSLKLAHKLQTINVQILLVNK